MAGKCGRLNGDAYWRCMLLRFHIDLKWSNFGLKHVFTLESKSLWPDLGVRFQHLFGMLEGRVGQFLAT